MAASRLSIEQCCQIVEREVARLAEVTDGVDPSTPVPTCGDWTVADLLLHAGQVYRWAGLTVAQAPTSRLPREELDFGEPRRPEELPAWFGAGAAEVVATFRAADPDQPLWAWGWPKAARFWPRRMVHELGVHRADAELALGIEPAFDPVIAADGVDELLDNLPHAAYFAPQVAELRGNGEVLALAAPDAGTAWRIELGDVGYTWHRLDGRPPADADATVEADSGQLLLGLWGRPAALDVRGDGELVALWRRASAL